MMGNNQLVPLHQGQSHAHSPLHMMDGESTVADYVYRCRHYMWLIAALAVGGAVAALAWSLTQTAVYMSKATVVIEQPGPVALEKDKGGHQPDFNPDYFQTHFELMRSRYVLRRSAERLQLDSRSEYKPNPSALFKTVRAIVPTFVRDWARPKSDQAEVSPEIQEDQLLKSFSQNIEIVPVRGARLAHVLAYSEDPRFAALVANTLSTTYIERTQEIAAKTSETSAKWFMDHLNELRNKVEASQQALYVFRSKHGLVAGHERQAVASQKLTELESELVKAEMRKAETQSRFSQFQSAVQDSGQKGIIDWSTLDASTEVLSSPLIQNLRAQEIKVSGDVAELSDKYGPLHPKLARAKAELQDLRERIQHEVQKIYDSMKREYEAAQVRERTIKEAVNRHKQEKLGVEQFEIERNILEREAESAQHLYEIFLKLTKEADLMSNMRNATVTLADPAVPSAFPVRPRTTLNALLGLVAGLMLGIGCALVLGSQSVILRSHHDVERFLPSLSVLGVVPRVVKTDASDDPLLLSADMRGPVAESVRIVRTSLLLSNPEDQPRCILVTSPSESEGKTTLAINLAIALAQLEGMRVLLVDADLRKATHHRMFQIRDRGGSPYGLVDYLMGRVDQKEIIHGVDEFGLSIIPRGSLSMNPSELLHSRALGKLLKWCREEGYFVILDAPPVLPVAEAAVLAPQVDGVLMVVGAGKTTREATSLALRRLVASGANILGVVVQKAEIRDIPYYYSYYTKVDS